MFVETRLSERNTLTISLLIKLRTYEIGFRTFINSQIITTYATLSFFLMYRLLHVTNQLVFIIVVLANG